MTAYNSYSDIELVDLLSQDDIHAFDVIYLRYWEELYKSAFVILKDTEASKDIVQDIFVWIWQNRSGLKIHFFKTYLKAAVKFKVANYIRSSNFRESFFEHLSRYNESSVMPAAEEMAEIKELNMIILEAILHLPDKCRSIFQLSRENHFTNQQIAEKLGISIKTVESQMTIAISRIRCAVQPHISSIFLITLLHNFFC